MTVHQYAVGMGATLVVVLCATIVGLVGRRILAPRWTGAIAALVVVVVAYSFLVVEGELLGVFGAFDRNPIVIASVASAAVALVLGRGRGRPDLAEPDGTPEEFPEVAKVDVLPRRRDFRFLPSWIASACAALVLAQGLIAVRATARTGNVFIDALQYHLTMAAHFATSHHTGGIVQLAPGSPVPYYPFNSELLHGMGIALLHRDSLSLLLTLADLGAALLAAWCVGSAYDLGPVALCAVTPLLALLGIYDASAINDWMAVWPLIALLAIAAHFRKDGDAATVGLPFLAGLAGGLAMGTKLSLLAPTLALLVGFLLLVPNRRKPAAAILVVVGAAITSVYWYIRDAVAVGSPFPSEHVPGLTRVPMAGFQQFGYSVAHYLDDSTVIRQYFHPGLEFFFGKAWIAILALAALGVVLSLVLGPGTARVAGVVAVIATGAYLVTPTGAFGPPGHPYLFEYNVRYALPAVVLGLLGLAISSLSRRWPLVASLGFLACLVVALLGPRVWALGTKDCAVAAAIALVVAAVVRVPLVRRFGTVLAVVAVLVLAAAGYSANKTYLRDRYHNVADSKGALYASLQDQSGVRIGVIGTSLYPFLGPTFTNTVDYIGETEAHHAFVDYATCSAWRAAVAAGNYAYVVIETSAGNPPPPALAWTQTDPSATPVVTNDAGGVFQVGPGFGSAPCTT
jgi:hypothetical protein